MRSAPCPHHRPCRPTGLSAPERLRLVLLDGTWRKSRARCSGQTPTLQALPRLALHHVPASRYAIRKAHAPHQLSTLEATQQALRHLEPANAGIAALGAAMQDFMARQQASTGPLRTGLCSTQTDS